MQQDEERNAKIKQLLVKTKKELADSKQAVSPAVNDCILPFLNWLLNNGLVAELQSGLLF